MFKDPDIGKPGQQLHEERLKRIQTARAVGVPDRVPVTCPIGYFPAKYAGIPCSAAYYDHDAWYEANEKCLREFRPDAFGASPFRPGKAMEKIVSKNIKWPGFGVEPNQGHQSVEIETLQADEFDLYMHDSNDYMLTRHMPRLNDSLKALAKIPPLHQVLHSYSPEALLSTVFADPEISEAIDLLQKVGKELRPVMEKNKEFMKLLESYGYYSSPMVGAMPPYDSISHSLRGMEGTMLDMFRQPEKLLELIDFVCDETIKHTPLIPDANGEMRIFMTNTRGSDDFLSKQQFDKFYWPTFKKLVTYLCGQGATPGIFFEGNFDSRIEYLLDLPKGKFVARFDTSDIFRAKEILKDHCCIEGNVPVSLLQVGSKEDVIAYCKKLIDVVGKDGGYILSPRSVTDEVNPVNFKAMIDFTKEYGVYN